MHNLLIECPTSPLQNSNNVESIVAYSAYHVNTYFVIDHGVDYYIRSVLTYKLKYC